VLHRTASHLKERRFRSSDHGKRHLYRQRLSAESLNRADRASIPHSACALQWEICGRLAVNYNRDDCGNIITPVIKYPPTRPASVVLIIGRASTADTLVMLSSASGPCVHRCHLSLSHKADNLLQFVCRKRASEPASKRATGYNRHCARVCLEQPGLFWLIAFILRSDN